MPHVTEWETLRESLLACCDRDLDRAGPAPHQERTRRQPLAEERPAMVALPPQPFPACQERHERVDSQSLVHCEGSFYSVPVRWAHHPCRVRQFVQVLQLFTEHPDDAVEQAIHTCVERRAFSPQAVALTLRNEPSPSCRALDLSDRPALMAVDAGRRDLAIYDQLN